MGGEIGVADSEENLSRMLAVYHDGCPGSSSLYSGHTDSLTEGDWRDVNTAGPQTWTNWEEGRPTNYYSADCSLIRVAGGKFYDHFCSQPACPVCQLQSPSPPRHSVLPGGPTYLSFLTMSKCDLLFDPLWKVHVARSVLPPHC